jgi:hypothetical protein
LATTTSLPIFAGTDRPEVPGYKGWGCSKIKHFDPTGIVKVNGRRQLEEMEMRNVRSGSHTWIKFDLAVTPSPSPRNKGTAPSPP